MYRRRLIALSVSPILAVGAVAAPPPAAAADRPAAISAITAASGDRPGEVTFRWTSSGANTDYFVLETGLTAFSTSSSSSLPRHGRQSAAFRIPAGARSWTMSADQAAAAGAPLGSANYLYYRFYAVNTEDGETATRAYPNLRAVMPRALSTSGSGGGTDLRVATFNVRTVKKTKDKRSWLRRVDDVAAEIVSSRAGVVLLQEASPGRADGKGGSTKKVGRQTTTLVDHLARQSRGRYDYKMVRTTSYLRSGLPRGTQGGRILYDNKRYRLLSSCPEKTGKKSYHAACSFKLPILSSDGESKRRRGGYALLQNRRTGQRFWAVSAHLDERHSSNRTTGARYDKLRGDQARYLVGLINKLNTRDYPVVFGADINTWQSDRSGYSAHDALIAAGYYDTAAATSSVNEEYTTSNGFATTLRRSTHGYGSHLDVVMVKGGKGGADRWVNMMANPDPARPSDHNLVYADVRI